MSPLIEGNQTVLRLTKNKDALAQLRRNGSLKKNKKGQEVLSMQFNSQTFEFSPTTQITVGATVARALVRSSSVIVGDHLTGELVPAIEVVTTYEAGKGLAQNTCPYCGLTKDTPQQLGMHLLKDCPELKAQKAIGTEQAPAGDDQNDEVEGENTEGDSEE